MHPAITSDVDVVGKLLVAGACVGLPTDTVYGLAARLASPDAIRDLFELKGRSLTNAIAVLVDSTATAQQLGVLDERALAIAEQFWPGPLTMVVRRRPGLDVDLGGDAAFIGLRVPAHELIRALATLVGPLATTSANRAGEPTLGSAVEIAECFGASLGAVLDGGPSADSASTVINVGGDELIVLREGPITAAQVRSLA